MRDPFGLLLKHLGHQRYLAVTGKLGHFINVNGDRIVGVVQVNIARGYLYGPVTEIFV